MPSDSTNYPDQTPVQMRQKRTAPCAQTFEFSSVDTQFKTLLVTSSSPTDNKSAVVANLAVAMADGDHPVILVDADLRRPAQHALFGLPNDAGFSTLFKDDDALKNPPLQSVANTSLKVLTSGQLPPHPQPTAGLPKNEPGAGTIDRNGRICYF